MSSNTFLLAIREGHTDTALKILASEPELEHANIFTASAAGNADRVATLIREDATLAQVTAGDEEWPPLAYACRSTLHRASGARALGLRRVAATLLDAGASANSFSLWRPDDGKALPNPVLYHACMSDHVELVTLLLERGARPNDGESIYHAAQHNRRACLEAMLAHGADLSSRQEPYGNTPLYFLVGHFEDDGGTAEWFKGVVWLLQHGADPNVPSGAAGETPLHGLAAGAPKPVTIELLLDRGADPNRPREDGRTPYAIAVRRGNRAAADLMRAHGADMGAVQPADEFLGACLAADERRARALLAANPALLASMSARDRSAIGDAVRQDLVDAIPLMVSLGFPVAGDACSATPLHEAAWFGKPAAVRALLAHGAPVNVRDGQFGSSPLGWAAHGSGIHRDQGRDADFIAVVEALLAAGADRPSSLNKWGEPPEGMASPAVADRIQESRDAMKTKVRARH